MRTRHAVHVAVWVCTALALAGACHRGNRPGAPRVQLHSCRLEGVSNEAQCGTYEVYEDRAARKWRTIALNIAVVKALAPSPEPDPLFILAGGPGQAATELAKALFPIFERVNRYRDLVFVDQRGTGKSHPLKCDAPEVDGGVEMDDDALLPQVLNGCLDKYDADVRLYTTPIAMDDLDEVRGALGYDKINLWGGSYGTRAGLVYMRQHPDRVRTATLDGVAPVDMRLPLSMARDGQRALDLLFDACSKEATCQKAFPDLRTRFASLLERLDAQPAKLVLPDPVTGHPEPISISRKGFAGTLRGILYIPDAASLIPLTISRAYDNDWSSFAAEASLLSGGMEKGLARGMFLSVICAEDAPLVRPEDVKPGTDGTFVGASITETMLKACGFWPRGKLPDGYHDPVKSDAPTLLLSGELDPVTPPFYAEAVASHLTHHLHVIVPGVGHGATPQGCVPRLINDFISRGSAEGLDTSCVKSLERPPFFVTFAGSTR